MKQNVYVVLQLFLEVPSEKNPEPKETTLELFGPFEGETTALANKAAEKWAMEAASFLRVKHATILNSDPPIGNLRFKDGI